MTPLETPKVPNGPTALSGSGNAQGPKLPAPPTGPGAPNPGSDEEDKSEKKNTGCRRPYEEILEENRQLAKRIQELAPAALPFAGIPDDQNKKADETLYVLNRNGREVRITPGQIRTLRAALGLV